MIIINLECMYVQALITSLFICVHCVEQGPIIAKQMNDVCKNRQ